MSDEISIPPATPAGGFPLGILVGNSPPDPKFLCAKCCLILRQPMQSFCGHRYCKSCLDVIFQTRHEEDDSDADENAKIFCEMCSQEGATSEYSVLRKDQMFPDNAIKREIKNREARCIHIPGCTWTGLFHEYEKHESECLFNTKNVARPDTDMTNTEMRQKVVDLVKAVASLQISMASSASASASPSATSASASPHGLPDVITNVAAHEEALKAYEDMFVVMSREIERNTNLIAESNAKYSEMVKYNETLQRKIQNIEHNLATRNSALTSVEEQVEALETASYNGVLVWKITDFAKHRADAISQRQTSLFSPAFYSNPVKGYKMRARIYLNGDGVGKGNHISLFFVVMKGRHDNLLKWPFPNKVTFKLLEQVHSNPEHIVDAFRPDPNSSSFKKPTTNSNIGSGCPLFVPLAHVMENPAHAYVKDDCIFVEISACDIAETVNSK